MIIRRFKMQICKELEAALMSYSMNSEEEVEIEIGLLNNELPIKDINNHNAYEIRDTRANTHMTNHSAGIYNCAYPTGATTVLMRN